MRTVLTIVGVILIILGAIWILQGVNILPGSFMTGQVRWAIIGGVAVIVGIVIISLANQGKPGRPKRIV